MKKNISTCLLALIFLLTGCNNGSNEKKSETGIKQVENKNINITESKKKPIPEIAKNLDDALKIFHNHNFGEADTNSINIDKIKMEFTNELFILKIEGFKNGKIYKLKIDDKAQILDEKIEKDTSDNTLALDFKNIISGVDAMEKALKNQSKGAWVKGYELKIEDKKAVYYINIAEGKDIKIDGVSGEIIEKD